MSIVRVVTGATGFVGSHFVQRWASDGERVVALVRPSAQGPAARLRAALDTAAAELGRELHEDVHRVSRAVASDVLQPSCGLAPDAVRELGKSSCGALWHFAASLKYEDRHRAAIFQNNVDGTRHALELARQLGCEWFVYVSTAYVAGTMQGSVPERRHITVPGFNNCYEASKARAEDEVARFCAEHGMRHVILRPSIVVGPFSTKSTGGSSTGLYGFVREVARVQGRLRALGRPLLLRGEPHTSCNLIPVDWFVDDVRALEREGLVDGSVHHHTCGRPLTIEQVGAAIARALDVPGFTVRPEVTSQRSPLEELIERRTGFYGGYCWNDKQFERSRAPLADLNVADVERYIRAGLAQPSGDKPAGAPALLRVGTR